MSIGFGYVTPEQIIKDKADLARKGIAKGRPLVVLEYADGILFVADNPSTHLHKIGELYDRIAFAAVGRFSEFESLRVAGVRLADLRGYSYGREDVSSRSIANAYSQTLGQIFSEGPKPYEIELCVAEVGTDGSPSSLYHVLYDGTVADRKGYLAIGGQADELDAELQRGHSDGMDLDAALGLAVRVLRGVSQASENSSRLEVAVLERGAGRRVFRRLTEDDVTNRAARSEATRSEPGVNPPEDGKAKDAT
jgi:proteasome alpha subunit